jgi:hypothetical protein
MTRAAFSPRTRLATFRSLAVGLALLGLSACGKADSKKCAQMCRNYATISFRDVEAARLPPEKREQALADKLTQGLDFCINKCVAANNDSQIDCMTAAKSVSQLKACE